MTGAVSPLPVSAPSFINRPRAAAATGGIRSAVSMSRLVSGMMPSRGPVRAITRETTGAAVQAAVVTPLFAGVGRGPSIITSTT